MAEMKPLMNGHDEPGEYPERDAARIAAREPLPEPGPVADLDGADGAFKQQQHDEILHGLDAYAEAYDGKIKEMNEANFRLGSDMLEQVAKVKQSITTMWLLGAAIDSKQRSDLAFIEKSERELEKLEH